MNQDPKRLLVSALIGAVLVAAAVLVAFTGGDDEATTAVTTAPRSLTTAAGPPPGSGPDAPEITFEYFDGTEATLATYEGQPLVVNFWASWCPSCVAEMSAAFRPAQQRLGDEVAFLGLNLQDRRAEAERLAEETGVLFDLAEDPNGVFYSEFGGFAMPYTVFISGHGEIVHEHNGPLTEDQLVDLIDEHLLSA
ncbi:MAG: TlpA disulfide reductase family protein [Acidimicrobiia bacterium]|nr:TlpA disulfide reductase family protein [Acidimicrobiia bacterium]